MNIKSSVEGKKYLLTLGKVDDVVDGDVYADPLGPRQLLVLPLPLGLERGRGGGGVGVVRVPPGVAGLEVVGGVVRVVAAIAVQRVAVGGGGEGLQVSVLVLHQHLLCQTLHSMKCWEGEGKSLFLPTYCSCVQSLFSLTLNGT